MYFYRAFDSPFGDFGLLWRELPDAARVYQIFLPNENDPAQVQALFGDVASAVQPEIGALGEQIQRFLAGEAVTFDLSLVELGRCGEFQRRVLLAEYGIPRGCVSTYGRIAAHLDASNSARAVGNALARNPFPLVIPCHRSVRANGELGGYRGGLPLKRALLQLEGVPVGVDGRVAAVPFYY